MGNRTRRAYLGLLGTAATAGLAGCSGVIGSTGSDAEQPQQATGTPATTDTPSNTTSGEPSAYTRVYRETIGSVVSIRVPSSGGGRGGSQGTGFVYDRRHALTNAHVVSEADQVEVQFNRGGSRRGEVVGRDRYADLAVVRIRNQPTYARALTLAESVPAVGTRVAAIGSPYSLQGSITSGIVSAVGRSIPSPAGYSIPNGLQTDAPVNPGNSGGPLVDLDGTVLGVINSGGGENIAFAISAPYVSRVVSGLIENGSYDHPYIGVGLAPVTQRLAREEDLANARGLLVRSVRSGSPADGTLQRGDVVLAIDGQQVESGQALSAYLEAETRPGDTVALTIRRNGQRQRVDLTLGTRPAPQRQSRAAPPSEVA